MLRSMSLGLTLLVLFACAVRAEDAPAAAAPETVDNFRLIDQRDTSWELYRFKEAPAVVLYIHGGGCPIVRQSVPELNRLKEAYAPKGVQFLMLNANTQDTRVDIRKEADDFKISMPILHDPTQRIALSLGVKRTAEAIVIVPKDHWRIVYRGAVDDRFDYGAQRDKAEHAWLRDALDAVLEGKPVAVAKSQVKGCLVSFEQPESVDYANDAGPILKAKCATCHVANGLGPFAMSNRRKVRGWAEQMREELRTQRMPPWHADPDYGTFHDSYALTTAEQRTLLAWLDAGAPDDGKGSDPLRADAQPKSEWTLGQPDVVLSMSRDEQLPAEGEIDYRYNYVMFPVQEDKWVRAAQVLPGNPSVVHHALIFMIYPEEYDHLQKEYHGGLEGYFEAYLPGAPVRPYPAGTGQFVPKGSVFVFQMHYTATGKPEHDRTRMGLYFCDAPPAKSLHTEAGFSTDFQIPANDADYPVFADYNFESDAEIFGFSPHMHYRGGRARFDVVLPGGARSTALNVPHYDFGWQPMYLLDTPLHVPKGTRIDISGAWDNSKFNPRNPDPNKSVEFGTQSWEEMFIGYVKYAVPRDEKLYSPRAVTRDKGNAITAESIVGTSWRIGGFSLGVEANGVLNLNHGMMKGKWSIDGPILHLEGAGQSLDVLIRGDQIIFNGRPVRLEREDPPAKSASAAVESAG